MIELLKNPAAVPFRFRLNLHAPASEPLELHGRNTNTLATEPLDYQDIFKLTVRTRSRTLRVPLQNPSYFPWNSRDQCGLCLKIARAFEHLNYTWHCCWIVIIAWLLCCESRTFSVNLWSQLQDIACMSVKNFTLFFSDQCVHRKSNIAI